MTTRRAVLTGAAALAVVPFAARAEAKTGFRAALDEIEAVLGKGAAGDARRAAALLERIDTRGLTASERLDLVTARAGVQIEIDLAGKPETSASMLRRKLGDRIDLRRAAHRLEVERRACMTRADVLFDRLGVRGTTAGVRFSAMWRDPRYRWSSAEAALADMDLWLARFRTAVPVLIGPVPIWCLDVAALPPTPSDLATGHFGYRTLPTPARTGGYVPDFARLAERPHFTLPSVVAHELLPGHMIQMPIEVAADPHPLRLRYAPGFAEGWGIYAERRVADADFYTEDPAAELGYLHWRLFRIGRAVIDLAIHIDRLPVSDARARLVAWQGEPAYFAPFDSDLARIVQEPMTRAAEMLASLAIEDGARGRTGKRLARYHQMLLANGRMRSDELARRARALV